MLSEFPPRQLTQTTWSELTAQTGDGGGSWDLGWTPQVKHFGQALETSEKKAYVQREIIYTPSPSPIPGQKAFSVEGGGGVYFEAPSGRNFVPPPLYKPPSPRSVFSGVGGGGVQNSAL